MATPHIVFLHGLNCSRKIFTYLHSQLPNHKATFIDYRSAQPAETSYKSILPLIPKDEPITLIGHSLGGILGYLIAVRNHNLPINNLISISTPFGGSVTASQLKWVYPSFSIFKDICPTSGIIREVTTNRNHQTQFTSIISTAGHLPFISEINDGVVSIRSQEATLASKVLRIDACHVEILQDSQTVDEVKRIVFP
jgi:hypothetical protein